VLRASFLAQPNTRQLMAKTGGYLSS
jgi:hypothetical protein